jgi:phospholipid/cholesterol/gamma-HCH transport system permease protein
VASRQGEIPILSPLGEAVMAGLVFLGEVTLLFVDTIRRMFAPPFEFKETLNQMAFVGFASIPIVALTTFSSGAVLALYTADIFVKYGASSFVGGTISLSVCREIAPVLAGIMVASRAGSAMAAQIGSMKVTEQIDALKSLNVNPTDFLVVPRVLAGVTMVPILALVGMYLGTAGGYFTSVYASGLASGQYMNSLEQFLDQEDVRGGLIKAAVFGLIITLVSCQQGLKTTQGAEGVGRSTTNTVVITMVLIYVANFVLTWFLWK